MSKNNMLIAEFMGAVILIKNAKFSDVQYPLNVNTKTRGQHKETYKQKIFSKHLEYDSNWNWINAVLQKIDEIPNDVCNDYFWPKKNQKNDFRIFRVRDIKELNNQIVDFINWYNNYNKPC